MRIIAGKGRSLPLKTIEGMDTRPTTDRIKETLFNMLQPYLADGTFLDLFAGSGQIGLEAVSRGAEHAVFVENNRRAAACIQDNIAFTKFDSQCTLLAMDVLSALHTLEGRHFFDVVFMDPPYRQGTERQVLEYLSTSALIDEASLVVVEAAKDTDLSYVQEYGYTIEKIKQYKTNQHVFLTRKGG